MEQTVIPRGKYAGTYPLYDDEDEWKKDYPTSPLYPYNDRDLLAGDWIQYSDGKIAQIQRVSGTRQDAKYVKTTRNVYTTAQRVATSEKGGRLRNPKLDLENIDPQKLKFAEQWLLQGLSLEQSVTNTLSSHLNRRGYSNFQKRKLAYLVISGIWFDKLLKDNRLMRERYMSLVGALGDAGINEAYVADKLKTAMEGENVKERMNALNQTIELLEAEASRRKRPIQANWSPVENPQLPSPPRAIPETNSLDTILKGLPNEEERSRSEVRETRGDASIQTVPSNVGAEAG